MDPPLEWLVIVNPNAGTRKGYRDWKEISGYFHKAGLSFEPVFTEGIGHAIQITRNKVNEGYRRIIVVGGDGTLNEAVNGIFTQEAVPTTSIKLGMVPVGTGNDWGRMFGIPSDYKKAINVIREGLTNLQDVGVAVYMNGGTNITRYFINSAGMGFDAEVVRKTNIDKQHGKGGFLIYLKNLIVSLIGYHSQKVVIEIDGLRRAGDYFSVSIGICRYTGGGMIQAPDALPDDGLFDVTLIRNISRIEAVTNIPRLFNGTIGKNPNVELLKGKKVSVYGEQEIFLEADGETLGHSPLEFSILPLSVCTIVAHKAQ